MSFVIVGSFISQSKTSHCDMPSESFYRSTLKRIFIRSASLTDVQLDPMKTSALQKTLLLADMLDSALGRPNVRKRTTFCCVLTSHRSMIQSHTNTSYQRSAYIWVFRQSRTLCCCFGACC